MDRLQHSLPLPASIAQTTTGPRIVSLTIHLPVGVGDTKDHCMQTAGWSVCRAWSLLLPYKLRMIYVLNNENCPSNTAVLGLKLGILLPQSLQRMSHCPQLLPSVVKAIPTNQLIKMCSFAYLCVPQHICVGHRRCRSQLSSSPSWVPRVGLHGKVLVTSAFAC